MSLDKRDSVNEFMREVEDLYERQKQSLPKLMIKRVTRHFMLTSRKIQRANIQRLNAKLWNGQLKSRDLLVTLLLIGKYRIICKGSEEGSE